MSDPTILFFCKVCGGSVAANDASTAACERADAEDFRCDDCAVLDVAALAASHAELLAALRLTLDLPGAVVGTTFRQTPTGRDEAAAEVRAIQAATRAAIARAEAVRGHE